VTEVKRADEIAEVMLLFKEETEMPIEEWPDDMWESVEECIANIYLDAWKGVVIDGKGIPVGTIEEIDVAEWVKEVMSD